MKKSRFLSLLLISLVTTFIFSLTANAQFFYTLVQNGVKDKAISFTFKPPYDDLSEFTYSIEYGDDAYHIINKVTLPGTTTSYTITGLKAGREYWVKIEYLFQDKSSPTQTKVGTTDSGFLYTLPAAPTGFKINWIDGRTGLEVDWADQQTYGYEYRIRNKSGKIVKKGTTGNEHLYVKLTNKQVYTIETRGYSVADGDTAKVYGPWSKKYYLVPVPMLKKHTISDDGTLKLSWQSIKGISQVEIYMTDKNFDKYSKYKKVATVKGNKTSVVIKKLKGKSFRYGQQYGIYLIGKKKVKGKTYASSVKSLPSGRSSFWDYAKRW